MSVFVDVFVDLIDSWLEFLGLLFLELEGFLGDDVLFGMLFVLLLLFGKYLVFFLFFELSCLVFCLNFIFLLLMICRLISENFFFLFNVLWVIDLLYDFDWFILCFFKVLLMLFFCILFF